MVVPRRLRLIWNFFAQAGPRRLALPVSSMSSTWNLNETTPATPAGTHILERELQGPVLHLEAGEASTLVMPTEENYLGRSFQGRTPLQLDWQPIQGLPRRL